jgi:hypothetical protein
MVMIAKTRCRMCQKTATELCEHFLTDGSTGLPYADCDSCGCITPVGEYCKCCGRLMPQFVPSQEDIARGTAVIRASNEREQLSRTSPRPDQNVGVRHSSIRRFSFRRRGRGGRAEIRQAEGA